MTTLLHGRPFDNDLKYFQCLYKAANARKAFQYPLMLFLKQSIALIASDSLLSGPLYGHDSSESLQHDDKLSCSDHFNMFLQLIIGEE